MRTHARVRAVLEQATVIALHVIAVLLAPVLLIAGLGMTMSVVLMPFGLGVGIAGMLLLGYGLWGWD